MPHPTPNHETAYPASPSSISPSRSSVSPDSIVPHISTPQMLLIELDVTIAGAFDPIVPQRGVGNHRRAIPISRLPTTLDLMIPHQDTYTLYRSHRRSTSPLTRPFQRTQASATARQHAGARRSRTTSSCHTPPIRDSESKARSTDHYAALSIPPISRATSTPASNIAPPSIAGHSNCQRRAGTPRYHRPPHRPTHAP